MFRANAKVPIVPYTELVRTARSGEWHYKPQEVPTNGLRVHD